MARKKSENKMTTEERLLSVKEEILETQEHLSSLKQKEKGLIEQKRQDDLNSLIEVIKTSGMSVDDIEELIKNKVTTNSTQNTKTA